MDTAARGGAARRGRTRDADRGFVLLEVLVAFTILALSLGALYQVFGSGMTAARLGDAYSRAVLHAQSALEAVGREQELAAGVTRGRFDDVYGWETTIAAYPWRGGGAPGTRSRVEPYTATVVVFWDDGPRRREVSLTTLLLGRGT